MLQSEMYTGKIGAKRQSWCRANPRELLKRLIEENPRSGEFELQRMFKDEVGANNDYLAAIVDYWFANNFRSLIAEDAELKQSFRPSLDKAKQTQAAAKTTTDVKSTLTAHIQRSAKLVLLDTVLPNGKKLRNATGADCKGLAPKMGVWLSKIAGKLKPEQTVGKVLSEKEIRDIYDGA